MKPSIRRIAGTAAIAATLALSATHATGSRPAPPPEALERDSGDLLTDPVRQRRATRIQDAATATGAARAVTPEDVYDVDSFGRTLKWLGTAQMNIALAPACGPPLPGDTVGGACAELLPSPATTSFAFEDVARITLPKNAAHSLLCHWFSPWLGITYRNPNPPGGAAVVGRLWYQPTLTIENPVLDDPTLIDPGTGLPFNGRLTTSVSNTEILEVPLPGGVQISSRERDTATCIAGFVTRQRLVDNYGLTEQQARQFFKRSTTIRMNISGSAQYVDSADMVFGLRVIGD
ncbi:hypothetical protein H0E84_04355 [Luteimonas sp. SJ-92]|uniref:Uncharacterized protein n=1 Tax=Luteimonas salinisoli TaxID=2752307 RepID=A0A853J9S5_9GAMM|nr:hypothetical protein [Luteimonas salinisoli]NZA25605.1 hypothetical protein [Luteimonas salinisoli]